MLPASRHALFTVLAITVGVLHLPVLRDLLHHSRGDASASHLLVIPLMTAAMIVRERQVIFARLETGRWAGLGLLVAGAGVALAVLVVPRLAVSEDALTIATAALVMMWLAVFLLAYGRAAFRAACFPLLFLFFMTPIPPVVLDAVVQLLKQGTAETVAVLFSASGTSYHRQGPVFLLPTLAIEVADECSGIRSSLALFLTSLLVGHVALRDRSKRLVLALFVLPITIFKNGVRIVVLSLLSVHVDPRIIEGQLHREGGVLFFALALAMLLPVFLVLRRMENSRATVVDETRTVVSL